MDNMDNALRMSKSGAEFRFVTLDGEVINARGAITEREIQKQDCEYTGSESRDRIAAKSDQRKKRSETAT